MASINKRYYSLVVSKDNKEASIYILGDIVSWEWFDSDVSSYTLAREIETLPEDVETINVYINSLGGEVAEGWTIYNMLMNNPAKIKTYAIGFVCSIAAVIFMAGDERIMYEESLLFVHNAWVTTTGNATKLRKEANNLEKISESSMIPFLKKANIEEEKLKELMESGSLLLPAEALEIGFATSIISEPASNKVAASAKKIIFNLIKEASLAKETRENFKQSNFDLKPNVNIEIDADKVANKLYSLLEEKYKPETGSENKLPNLLAALFRQII